MRTPKVYDLIHHLRRQITFSLKAFGPCDVDRTEGILNHIEKEIEEVRENPSDTEEWIDLAILAFEGAWRNGATERHIAKVFRDKLHKNENREWPDWREADPTKAIEHKR